MPKCSIGRKQFLDSARPLKVVINDVPLHAAIKEFKTGSFGWYLNGKMMVDVDGVSVNVQIGLNLTVVGSKDAPKD